MWDGRFESGLDKDMERLSYSLHYDKVLYPEDIAGSIAQAHALQEAGVLSKQEANKITRGLKSIEIDLDKGVELFKSSDEDIHMAIERILTDRLGELGKKLHTGRSRNDQVATDFRLYLRNKTALLQQRIRDLQKSVYEKALEAEWSMMPGYTHLQQGQPIYTAHYFLALFWALERDIQRFENFMITSGKLPLGSGALAGSGFKYNRKKVAKELGFTGITENSIDGTAHRDFVLEFLSTTAIVGNLLSRYAEDFVIWSSAEFGFITLHDSFSTGSSMMPQKKNPDSMELIRGKSGRLLGNYTSVFTAAKGAPLCYSRDLQEDKEPVFDSVETLDTCLAVMAKAIASLTLNKERMEKKLDPGLLATDLADYLVKAKVPFREAHHIVGSLVKQAELNHTDLLHLPDSFWKDLPKGLEIKKKLSFLDSVENRSIEGGTGRASVKKQLTQAQKLLKKSGFKLDS